MAQRFEPGDMDVVVGVYGDEESARAGLEAVRRAVHDKAMVIHDAAVVVRDREGKTLRIEDGIGMRTLPGAGIGLLIGAIVGMFAGPIGFVVATAGGALVGGITGYELEHPSHPRTTAIARSLQAGEAEVIVVAPCGGDGPAVADMLRASAAEVHETTLDEATVTAACARAESEQDT